MCACRRGRVRVLGRCSDSPSLDEKQELCGDPSSLPSTVVRPFQAKPGQLHSGSPAVPWKNAITLLAPVPTFTEHDGHRDVQSQQSWTWPPLLSRSSALAIAQSASVIDPLSMEAHSDLRVRVRRLVCCQGPYYSGFALARYEPLVLYVYAAGTRIYPGLLGQRSFVRGPFKEKNVATVRRHRHR